MIDRWAMMDYAIIQRLSLTHVYAFYFWENIIYIAVKMKLRTRKEMSQMFNISL